jgi:hypothetical protein
MQDPHRPERRTPPVPNPTGDEALTVSAKSARGAKLGRRVFYVLIASLTLALMAMAIVLIVFWSPDWAS